MRVQGLRLLLAFVTATGCSSNSSSGGGGTVTVSASGETFALSGYAFPPTADQEVLVVDGWAVAFTKVLVVIDKPRLSENPDQSPSDPSKLGKTVAQLEGGPWAVDLAKAGDRDGVGGSGDKAWMLGIIDKQNTNGNAAIDGAQRYAFSYDTVAATSSVKAFRGLEANDADFAEMVQKGYSHFLIGTATFKADAASCKGAIASYDYTKMPKAVDFRFGLSAPVSALNCQNGDLKGAALTGETLQRGVQAKAGSTAIAQIVLHLDHLFWQTVVHDLGVPHFDHLAAQAKDANGKFVVTNAELGAASLAPVKDSAGNSVPWRSCVEESKYKLPTAPAEFTMDTQGNTGIQNISDFIKTTGATMHHLNAEDGFCYVPGFSTVK